MRILAVLTTITVYNATASGQLNGRYEFEFSRTTVSSATPVVTIGVLAAWDWPVPGETLFGAGNYDLAASSGEFTDAILVLGAMPPNNPGALNGKRVDGAAIGQVHIPSIGLHGDPSNPLLLAEYTWTTSDFTHRIVEFTTENTTNFGIILPDISINLFPHQFAPGFGSIMVVPGPGGFAILGLGGLIASWRRR